MAYNDEWCDLCNNKMKQVTGTFNGNGREISICEPCAYFSPSFIENKEGKQMRGNTTFIIVIETGSTQYKETKFITYPNKQEALRYILSLKQRSVMDDPVKPIRVFQLDEFGGTKMYELILNGFDLELQAKLEVKGIV